MDFQKNHEKLNTKGKNRKKKRRKKETETKLKKNEKPTKS